MSILTIKNDVLEADFDQLIERWSKDPDEIVGTSNKSNCCPIAVLFKEENPDVRFIDVRVEDCIFTMGANIPQSVSLSSRLQDFVELLDFTFGGFEESEQEDVIASDAVRIVKTVIADWEDGAQT